MRNRILVKLYAILPKYLKKRLGQSSLLKPLRRSLLYKNGGFKVAEEIILRQYGKYNLKFRFVASIKIVAKAKKTGIENTVLRNSFHLLDTYFKNRTDLTVLDVGANFGYLSTVWAHSVTKDGQTIAFEPNKNLFLCIQQTIKANNLANHFQVDNLAVGSTNGSITLNVSHFSSNTNPMDEAINTYDVAMITLDDYLKELQNIHLIKIDVDGIELDILQGAKHILTQKKPIVIVETNNDRRIVSFFNDLNYTIFDMKLNTFGIKSETLPLNIFCVPKELVANAV